MLQTLYTVYLIIYWLLDENWHLFGSKEKKNREELSLFLSSERVKIVDITSNTSENFSLLVSKLRLSGNPIPSNDAWIAASAMEHGAAVASRDSHFREIEGVQFLDLS